jgi:hypothetical protein
MIQKRVGAIILLQLDPGRTQRPISIHEEANGVITAGEDGMELEIILPCKPKQALDRPARVHRQRPAPASQRGKEPKSVLERVWRLRRALAVLQQPTRGGQAPEGVQLQTHE